MASVEVFVERPPSRAGMDLHIAALTQLSALRLPGPPTGGSKYNKAENCVFGGTGRVPIKNGAYRMERLKHADKSNLA